MISVNDLDNIVGGTVAGLRLDVSSVKSFYRNISMIQAQGFDQ